MAESALLTGPLEPTNEPYAIAKIAAMKLCESHQRQHGRRYVSVMPASLYGPNDNYEPGASHVLPALLRRTTMLPRATPTSSSSGQRHAAA
jgi:GDP-L-fucose synthase